jgi:hypothetical protein
MRSLLLILFSFSLYASEALFDQYCVSCHFKEQITFKQMKAQRQHLQAPPISVVMERIKKYIVVDLDDEDVLKAVVTAYMKDYVLDPSIDKGICHVNCYVQFGTMPSQKGKVPPEALEKIVSWVYDSY